MSARYNPQNPRLSRPCCHPEQAKDLSAIRLGTTPTPRTDPTPRANPTRCHPERHPKDGRRISTAPRHSTSPHQTHAPEKISSQSAPTHEIFLTLTPTPRIPTIEEASALSQPLEKVPRSPAWQRKQKKPQSPQKRASRHQKKKGAATCSALLQTLLFRICVFSASSVVNSSSTASAPQARRPSNTRPSS